MGEEKKNMRTKEVKERKNWQKNRNRGKRKNGNKKKGRKKKKSREKIIRLTSFVDLSKWKTSVVYIGGIAT